MDGFGINLRRLRKYKGLTQKQLANKLHVSKSCVNMYERGEREPCIEILCKISDIFMVDVDYLIGRRKINLKHLDNAEQQQKMHDAILVIGSMLSVTRRFRDTWASNDLVVSLETVLEALLRAAEYTTDVRVNRKTLWFKDETMGVYAKNYRDVLTESTAEELSLQAAVCIKLLLGYAKREPAIYGERIFTERYINALEVCREVLGLDLDKV